MCMTELKVLRFDNNKVNPIMKYTIILGFIFNTVTWNIIYLFVYLFIFFFIFFLRHDITEILLEVALNNITLTPYFLRR
jgi:hypothetical protein